MRLRRILYGVALASDDYFDLFGLPRRFALDSAALEAAWRDVAARVHPDRFALASPAERRVAMQWAARANEAYRQLRDPLLRAQYLCEQAGVDLQTESNTSMDTAFLMQQMERREMLDEARADAGNAHAYDALRGALSEAEAGFAATLTRLIDEAGDFPEAAAKTREWMFVRRISQELSQAATAP